MTEARHLINKILEKKLGIDEYIEPIQSALMDFLITRKVLTSYETSVLDHLLELFRQKFDGTNDEYILYIDDLQSGEKY